MKEVIRKILKEETFRNRIIDMIENARHEFITHREKQCIGDL